MPSQQYTLGEGYNVIVLDTVVRRRFGVLEGRGLRAVLQCVVSGALTANFCALGFYRLDTRFRSL